MTSERCAISNLVDHCRALAASQGDSPAYTWLRDGEVEDGSLSFAQLDAHARKIAAHLDERRLGGERVLLLYSPGLEFIAAFIGCLYAGVVAVPMNTPRNERAAAMSLGVARHAGPAIRLTDSSVLSASWNRLDLFGSLDALATDQIPLKDGDGWFPGKIRPDDLALIQYTSGSTGSPKGVELSHRNLVRNQEMIRESFKNDSSTIFTSWLPVFHDMGLIGNVLQPLFLGIHSILMAPSAFVQKPVRWLQAMARYRATTTGGPNFGYELCVQRVRPEQVEELDLSSWKLAYNGSEPVRVNTMERFAEKFAPAGFRREAFYPCYGLAEASLFVTGGIAGEPFSVLSVDGEALKEDRVLPASAEDPNSKRLVGCGRGWISQRVLIVDHRTLRPVEDGAVGEIWLQGENLARGYRNLPLESEDPFAARLESGDGPFLRTGDLGFVRGGELFVTGRLKDILIQNGQNYYPQDLELVAGESHPSFLVDRSAAFTVDSEDGERVVIVQEVHRDCTRLLDQETPEGAELRKELVAAVRGAISAHFGLHAWRVVLIRHASMPVTSSGKVQRGKCRTMWARRELAELAASPTPG